MFRNHLTSILRNLKRNKAYAAINISGLAMGFAAALLIGIYVSKEFTYDQHYKNHESIYRLSGRSFALSSIAHLNKIKQDVPGIDAIVNLMPSPSATLTLTDNQSFVDKSVYYTTDEYFQVFEHQMVYGNMDDALSVPNGLIITQSMATKFFGNQNPMGQEITLATQISQDLFEVTGVVEDLPTNTSLKFSVLARLPREFEERIKDSYSFTTGYSYFKTESKAEAATLDQRINDLFMKVDYERFGQERSFEAFKADYTPGLLVMPLKAVHLESNIQFEASESGSRRYLFIFISIALFVVVLAAINYVNLATAQASKRAKEIGVRTVLGSYRRQLIQRFLAESLFVALCAIIVSFGLTEAALQGLQVVGIEELGANTFQHPQLLLLITLIGLVTGLLAGVYPAFYLTRINASTALKGSYSVGEKSKLFRNGLVVFQFVISLSLAVFSLFAQQQLQYSLEKDLGFDKERVIVVDNSKSQLGEEDENREPLRQELLRQANVKSVSFSHYSMINQLPLSGMSELVPDAEYQRIQYKYTDDQFIPTMGMKLVEGRNFNPEIDDERTVAVINQSFAQKLGGKVLGRKFDAGFNGREVEVIGVVEDFHYQNFSNAIGPVVFFYRVYASQINIAFSGNPKDALESIGNTYAGLSDAPFDYYFFDQQFDQLFKREARLGQIIKLFTGLSVFVATLGLIGLISYKLDQRIKEIGIRKVLGASVSQILSLLSKEVVVLIIIALFISIPISYYAVSSWMNDFAYHIDLSVLPFASVAVMAIITILVIVTIRSYRTAIANPINALRNE
ncbi:hypothetical protein BFP97_07550 [Roseivirga sp. 4D4]|uniref:ABC transporter permease n=1 Tax=Roseivirga sp. 4D4 TaxID=1889784 RepID=UPI00085367D2|nr:ABC transporter permease [Roseivirga sp. 4D4]OEK01380.1 hypothetical protein BFP97_07550 [Roseivirga sp. 4D4]